MTKPCTVPGRGHSHSASSFIPHSSFVIRTCYLAITVPDPKLNCGALYLPLCRWPCHPISLQELPFGSPVTNAIYRRKRDRISRPYRGALRSYATRTGLCAVGRSLCEFICLRAQLNYSAKVPATDRFRKVEKYPEEFISNDRCIFCGMCRGVPAQAIFCVMILHYGFTARQVHAKAKLREIGWRNSRRRTEMEETK